VRPRHRPAPRAARIGFLALLSGGGRIDGALERARLEMHVDAAWERLDIDVRARASDQHALDNALAGRAHLALAGRDPHEQREVERCQRYVTITAELPDSAELLVLQAALALLRALAAEQELLLALDRSSARWWAPAELLALAAGRALDLDEHVQLVVEAVERRPGVGHLVRSRGLEKLARPDVGGRVPRRDAERIAELLRDLARLLLEGEILEPGDRLLTPELPPLTLVPRTDDCLSPASPDEAPLYELRDLDPAGRPGPSLAALLAAVRPRPRLRIVK
jgi:hypothetical protein